MIVYSFPRPLGMESARSMVGKDGNTRPGTCQCPVVVYPIDFAGGWKLNQYCIIGISQFTILSYSLGNNIIRYREFLKYNIFSPTKGMFIVRVELAKDFESVAMDGPYRFNQCLLVFKRWDSKCILIHDII